MNFEIHTLVDITETHARRGEGEPYQQQQNYMTVLQTIGLRTNPSNVSVTSSKQQLSKLAFGRKYKGAHTVWTFKFSIEAEASHSEELLLNDFDMVPFIPQLTETVAFDKSVFYVQDQDLCNIIFKQSDK